MADRMPPDRDHLVRPPEEAAIESWVEDSGIYLRIPVAVPSDREIVARSDGRLQIDEKTAGLSIVPDPD